MSPTVSRISTRWLLLALGLALTQGACISRTVSCDRGFRASGAGNNSFWVPKIRKASDARTPAHGIIAAQLNGNASFRYLNPDVEPGWISGDSGGAWMDVCEFKCLGTRRSLDAYEQALTQSRASGALTAAKAAEAEGEIQIYRQRLSTAVADCRRTSFRVRGRRYGDLFGNALMMANAGGCGCFGPDLSPLAEKIELGPQRDYEDLAVNQNQNRSTRNRAGARNQAAGAMGEDPLAEVAQGGMGGDGALESLAIAGRTSAPSADGIETVAPATGRVRARRPASDGRGFGAGPLAAGGPGAFNRIGEPAKPSADETALKEKGPLHDPYSDDPDARYRRVGTATGGSAAERESVRVSGEGGSSELAFGEQGAAGDGGTLSLDDPADYFTRLGLGDNLFKIVERRYRSTSANWALAALRERRPAAAAPASSGVPPTTDRAGATSAAGNRRGAAPGAGH
jgi:hypothetical protein